MLMDKDGRMRKLLPPTVATAIQSQISSERLVKEGIESALNRKPSKTPPRQTIIDGEVEAKLIALRCGEPPAGQARWTLRLLADIAVELEIVPAISHETVRQVLKKTNSNLICGRCM